MKLASLIVLALLLSGCSDEVFASNKLVEIARTQVGLGEKGKDNAGDIVLKYTKGRQIPWCASFVSWSLEQAGYSGGYLFSARSFWTSGSFERVSVPREGDIVVFTRGNPKGRMGHVGIVERVDGGKLTTIEGNVGSYPAHVKRRHYTLGKMPRLLGFVRLSKKGN